MVEMFTRQQVETRVFPMVLDHGVGSKLIAVPRREDEVARKPFEQVSKFRFVRFRPRIEVVHVAARIRRVGIDQIARLSGRERLPKVRGAERPVTGGNDFGDAPDLVGDFGDVSLGKTLRFVAVRHIEFPVAIESHHTVEARTVEEKEVE